MKDYFKILGLDTTDPYDEPDIKYIKTLQGSYDEIMENAHYYYHRLPIERKAEA